MALATNRDFGGGICPYALVPKAAAESHRLGKRRRVCGIYPGRLGFAPTLIGHSPTRPSYVGVYTEASTSARQRSSSAPDTRLSEIDKRFSIVSCVI